MIIRLPSRSRLLQQQAASVNTVVFYTSSTRWKLEDKSLLRVNLIKNDTVCVSELQTLAPGLMVLLHGNVGFTVPVWSERSEL